MGGSVRRFLGIAGIGWGSVGICEGFGGDRLGIGGIGWVVGGCFGGVFGLYRSPDISDIYAGISTGFHSPIWAQ